MDKAEVSLGQIIGCGWRLIDDTKQAGKGDVLSGLISVDISVTRQLIYERSFYIYIAWQQLMSGKSLYLYEHSPYHLRKVGHGQLDTWAQKTRMPVRMSDWCTMILVFLILLFVGTIIIIVIFITTTIVIVIFITTIFLKVPACAANCYNEYTGRRISVGRWNDTGEDWSLSIISLSLHLLPSNLSSWAPCVIRSAGNLCPTLSQSIGAFAGNLRSAHRTD